MKIPEKVRSLEDADETAYGLALVGLASLCYLCDSLIPDDLNDEIDPGKYCEECRLSSEAARALVGRLVSLGEGDRAVKILEALRPWQK